MSIEQGSKGPEEPEKKIRTKCTVELGRARVHLNKRKSEFTNHVRVEMIFDDFYQSELADQFGWDAAQIDSIDTQLFAKLQDKGAMINWEDKEYFMVDLPQDATQDVITDVESALQSAFRSPLSTKEEIEKANQLHRAIKARQEELAQQELAKIRIEERPFWAYKKKPSAASPADHEGYCTVNKIKIKKSKGITYQDQEFLGQEYRKIALEPKMVILNITVSGEPFKRLYRGRIIQEGQYGFGDYESELQKIIQSLQSSPEEIVKISHQVATKINRVADGEHVKLLCSEEFANKIVEQLKMLYLDLDDRSKEQE
jgi:hypothetical protein